MKAWNNFLDNLEIDIGKKTVDRWLRTLNIVRFDACNLYLEAKDAFQLLWFEEHIRKLTSEKLINNNNNKIKIHINTSSFGKNKESTKRKRSFKQKFNNNEKFLINFDSIDPNLTIEKFISTEKNLLAHKLISKIINFEPVSSKLVNSDLELASFNPIFLHGPTGTGKTHLLSAVYHSLKAKDLKVIYVTADKFTQHVVSAIRSGEMALFRNTYRNIDILLVDDVHVLSKKGATQEEFFHTFNTLHLSGKQIILTSNNSPQELQNIEPRLISRFEWGIVLPIDPLEDKDLPKALEEKLQTLQVTLNKKVEEFLLETFTSNVKSLMQAAETLVYRFSLKESFKKLSMPATIGITLTKKLLKDLIEEENAKILTPQKIIGKVADYFNLFTEDIYKKSQKRENVVPRHLAIYFCRKKLNIPYKKIGDLFSKDHSTIMSSVKLVETAISSNNKEITTPYFAIKRKLHT